MYYVPLAFHCIYGRRDGGENGEREEGNEWILSGILHADDLVLCGTSEEELRAIELVGRFVEVFRRGGLKVNAGKSKVMVLGGEEGLEYEVCVDWIRLEHVSEFNYLGCYYYHLASISQQAALQALYYCR